MNKQINAVKVAYDSDLGRACERFRQRYKNADDYHWLYHEMIFDRIRNGEITNDQAAVEIDKLLE